MDFLVAIVNMDNDDDETGLISYVDPTASTVLLRLACKYMYPNHAVATELRRRCIKAAAENWENSLMPLYRQEKKRRLEQDVGKRLGDA